MRKLFDHRVIVKTELYRKTLKDMITVLKDEIVQTHDLETFKPSDSLQSMAHGLVQKAIELQTTIEFYDKLYEDRTKTTDVNEMPDIHDHVLDIRDSFYLGASRQCASSKLQKHYQFDGTVEEANDEIDDICLDVGIYVKNMNEFDVLTEKIISEGGNTEINQKDFYLCKNPGNQALLIRKENHIISTLKELKIPFLDEGVEIGPELIKVLTLQVKPE